MSYTNPTQYVDTTSAKHIEKLQDTIKSSVAQVGQAYALHQKEIRAENKLLEKENKAIQTGINDKVADIRANIYTTDINNPDVDLATPFEPFVAEYKALAEAVAFGTSQNPAEDRKRMAKLIARVGGAANSITNLASQSTDFTTLLQKQGKRGGYAATNDPNVIKAVAIMTGSLGGTKKMVFENGDEDKLAWEIYDNSNTLVASFSEEQLQQLSKNNSELLIVIPDNTQANNDLQTYQGNTVWEKGKKQADSTFKPSGKITKTYLNGYLPDGSFDTTQFQTEELLKDNVKTNWFQAYATVNKEAIKKDSGFLDEINSDSSAILGQDVDTSGAKAYHNAYNADVKYKSSDFIGNSAVINPDTGKIYTHESELPDEIKNAIEDLDNNGYQFTFKGGAMTAAQEAIFKVGYSNSYIKNEIPDRQAVGVPQFNEYKDPNKTKTLAEYRKENETYLLNMNKGGKYASNIIDPNTKKTKIYGSNEGGAGLLTAIKKDPRWRGYENVIDSNYLPLVSGGKFIKRAKTKIDKTETAIYLAELGFGKGVTIDSLNPTGHVADNVTLTKKQIKDKIKARVDAKMLAYEQNLDKGLVWNLNVSKSSPGQVLTTEQLIRQLPGRFSAVTAKGAN